MSQSRGDNTCCRSALRAILRGLNYVLAVIGILMTAYALFMYHEWAEEGGGAHAPPPVPAPPAFAPPPPHSTAPSAEYPLHRRSQLIMGPVRLAGDDPTRSVRRSWSATSQADASGDQTLGQYPWFIYVFGGAGMFVFLTAAVGIMSADCAGCGVTCFLGLYHIMMVLMLFIQVAVIIFYFWDKSWERNLPDDTTGEYKKMKHLILEHLRLCQIAGLSTLGLQVLALMTSCSVYYAESKPRLEYRVLAQYDTDVASVSSYGHGAAPAPHAVNYPRSGNAPARAVSGGVPGNPWSRRMHDRYGGGDEA